MPEVYFDLGDALSYIAELYNDAYSPSVSEYIEFLGVKEFAPVIEDEMAHLFKFLLKLTKPKNILEIGMSIGYSTTSMALAVKEYGGRITTLEIDEDIIPTAKRAFKHYNVDDVIDIRLGNANEILETLESESFDVVFQDASKKLYPVMLEDCVRVLKKGGLFLIDDTLFPVMREKSEWNDSFKAIHDFNKKILKSSVFSTLLPIGEGCTIAVRE
ncbi:MAG: O-methyltransferase [Candidatus Thorarchaeota archaeon]